MTEYQFPLATPQHRLGGKAVDYAMYVVTLGIGWFIWSLVVWGQGQTPGQQIVKLRVYDKTTGKRVKWGHMAIREFLLPLAAGILSGVAAGILIAIATSGSSLSDHPWAVFFAYIPVMAIFLVDAIFIFKDDKRNRLVDIISKTDVLNESPAIA